METISLSDAVKYPFKTPYRLLYILLFIIPIIGPLILWGYIVKLVNEFIEGRYEGLVKIDIIVDFVIGFVMFLKFIPFLVFCVIGFVVLYILLFIIFNDISTTALILEIISSLFMLLVIPILIVNFFKKQTIKSLFEFNILKNVADNFGDYVVAVLKQWALSIVFLVLSLVIIGIPAMYFTSSIFIANFYGNFVEQNHTLPFNTQSKDPLTV